MAAHLIGPTLRINEWLWVRSLKPLPLTE